MIRIIAFDETKYWNMELPKGCKMLTVYAYDDEKATYCCEITQSRECHYLGIIPTIVPDDDDDGREKFLESVYSGTYDIESIAYYHCGYVDSRGFIKGCNADNDEDEDDNALENTADGFRCNESAYEMSIINLFSMEK